MKLFFVFLKECLLHVTKKLRIHVTGMFLLLMTKQQKIPEWQYLQWCTRNIEMTSRWVHNINVYNWIRVPENPNHKNRSKIQQDWDSNFIKKQKADKHFETEPLHLSLFFTAYLIVYRNQFWLTHI